MTTPATNAPRIGTVLVVDDSAFARQGAILCLRSAGLTDAEFSEAANGTTALDHLRTKGADLVVTDLNMPEMDGRELLAQIKSEHELASTRVVVVSSLINDALRDELLELGADNVTAKPLSGAATMKMLRLLVQGS